MCFLQTLVEQHTLQEDVDWWKIQIMQNQGGFSCWDPGTEPQNWTLANQDNELITTAFSI